MRSRTHRPKYLSCLLSRILRKTLKVALQLFVNGKKLSQVKELSAKKVHKNKRWTSLLLLIIKITETRKWSNSGRLTYQHQSPSSWQHNLIAVKMNNMQICRKTTHQSRCHHRDNVGDHFAMLSWNVHGYSELKWELLRNKYKDLHVVCL
jgi:hypothetical protein